MKKWKKYLIISVVFIVLAIFAFLIQYGVYNSVSTNQFTWSTNGLSFVGNALQISGILSIASGLLYYTASEGSFDGLVFATKQFYHALFRKTKYPYTYSEYKLIKHPENEKKVNIWPFIIIGLIFVIIGFIVFYM